MKDISFYSNSTYLSLPTRNNPRVELAIDSVEVKNNSFKFYLPFSFKAKALKKLALLFPVFNIKKAKKSAFIDFIEQRYQKTIVVSIYHSTDQDKVVLQLQSNNIIMGYMKVGITAKGNQRICAEQKALMLLENDCIPSLMDSGIFNEHNFILIESVNGTSDLLTEKQDLELLSLINKGREIGQTHLNKHPRIIKLDKELQQLKHEELYSFFDALDLDRQVSISYEHGDFAPWNILKSATKVTLIDFEYFIENGLSEFDVIKYHYQVAVLLKKLKGMDLVNYLNLKINFKGFNIFMTLFLLKEISIKASVNKEYLEEVSLLKILKGLK